MNELQQQLAFAQRFVDLNLYDLSAEVLALQQGQYVGLKLRDLRELCRFAGHSALSVALDLVYKAALVKILADKEHT